MIKDAEILEVKEVAENIFHMIIEEPLIAQSSVPGQFLFVRVDKRLAPFLRRPFSVAGASPEEGTVELLFSVVGEGTEVMSRLHPGQLLNCFGPLGSGFKLHEQNGPALIVAGGIGIAPLIFLCRVLLQDKRTPFLFYGTASYNIMIPLEDFYLEGVEVVLATEDGSRGFRGQVTEAVENFLLRETFFPVDIFACGPRPMLQELVLKNKDWELPMQVSLEERMACGVGACRGCAVEVVEKGDTLFKRVCRDGPVFDSLEVVW